MAYFATEYTIHFDDTMAYGSHHFLTAFKFQCAARESFLFGERILDLPGVRESLDEIHLLTADAYARNHNPAKLGDRVAILLTLEEWGKVSARFCYRIIGEQGQPIGAGFQTLICADARSGEPTPLPSPLEKAMEAMREIEEVSESSSFRERVLAGGSEADSLFCETSRATAKQYLNQRYPAPGVISPVMPAAISTSTSNQSASQRVDSADEVWMFSGQGAFDPKLLSDRVASYTNADSHARHELNEAAIIAAEYLGGDAASVISGSDTRCKDAVAATPALLQFAIYLQNVLGAVDWERQGHRPTFLMGHSFGEIAALGAGGCFDLKTGVRIVCERVRAVTDLGPAGGGLLVVSSNRQNIATEAELLGLEQIVIAGRNHEGQTVVSGPAEQLERLRERMRECHAEAVTIPSPTSFHHPQLRAAASAWLEKLRSLPLVGPSMEVYSPISRRFISPNDDIPATLASQLVRPFDLQGGIEDVVQLGAARFVDCGSTGSLARLISKAAPKDIEVICAASQQAASTDPTVAGNFVPRETKRGREGRLRDAPHDDPDRTLIPQVALLGTGCILPGGACSPEQLYSAICDQRLGIVDQNTVDPNWSDDFYSSELVPDLSTSPLSGLVQNSDITVPDGVDPDVFRRFTRTQKLLCIALAPCVASLQGADKILCLVGASADGFEDQDEVCSLRVAGIDPTDENVDERMQTDRSAFQDPHQAVQDVFDKIVRPGLKVTLVDAACASSLFAVALGMHALETGETDAVIAGGVFCPGPGNSCLFSQFQGTTSTGCRPFDANADGVVFSEGSAMVTLRRVEDAEKWSLPISAIVRGTGLSSDGRSSSANVPQTSGQILSLQRCYSNYEIDAASIQAIEGHGTSTPVGDSTELETLRQFFSDEKIPRPIPVHSLKGLLGHAGWAAGTASIIAACEYMRQGVFPRQAFHRQPSEALKRSVGTLEVPTESVTLPSGPRRIAIDGFGFGGANAHLVLDSYSPGQAIRSDSPSATPPRSNVELAIVAGYQVRPTSDNGRRFDRKNLTLPTGHLLLPDLQDDMDVSQTLAISLLDGVLAQIPDLDDDLRRETSIVLALRGKTERGVEATARVLAPRIRRNLAGLDQLVENLNIAVADIKPSGPYTLQCMMPNVAAGRAALQFNLNGPNFAVDAGENSLEAAMSSASLLLTGGENCGTKLVIVMAIEANIWQIPGPGLRGEGHQEYAAAFAVTTRDDAEQLGLKTACDLQPAMQEIERVATTPSETLIARKLRTLFQRISPPSNAESESERDGAVEPTKFPIHHPVWIESPRSHQLFDSSGANANNLLAIVTADDPNIDTVLQVLPSYSQRHLVVVVGNRAKEIAARIRNENLVAIETLTDSNLSKVEQFRADLVVAIQSVHNWDFSETLDQTATDNTLCELLFLVAKTMASRLAAGSSEIWGLFPGGWNGKIHPSTGSITGLLKAIRRENPKLRAGVISTQQDSVLDVLQHLHDERQQREVESEVAYDQRRRFVRRLRSCPQGHRTSKPRVNLTADSVVLITGGARGVTAIMMESLLRDYQCTVVAIGRSALEEGPSNTGASNAETEFYAEYMQEHPSASAVEMKTEFEAARARWEAFETIQRLATLGGRVEYMQADVTDAAQVNAVIGTMAARYGRIDFVVHGAGVQWSKRLDRRSLDEFRRTFDVKVAGLRNVVEGCQVEFSKTVPVHVLTSAYSIFGNDGQHDYGAANETLDRLCDLTENVDGIDWSSIAWLAWDGVGMTRGSEYRALAEQRGLSGLKANDGRRIFRAVLDGRTDGAINVPLSEAEHAKYNLRTIPPQTSSQPSHRIREDIVDLSKLECLPFHVVRDKPTLPGAWILERMVNAGLQLVEDVKKVTAVSIENASFERFVRSMNNADLRVVAEKTHDGTHVWMVGDVFHPSGYRLLKDKVFSYAFLSFIDDPAFISPVLRELVAREDKERTPVSDPYCGGSENDVVLSGPFDCVRDVKIGPDGRQARFAPNKNCLWPGVIPALLLDAALRVGAMYAGEDRDALFVPARIGRLVVPIGMDASSVAAFGWNIHTSAPRIEDQNVIWDRTEVTNGSGGVRLLVENSLATRLR